MLYVADTLKIICVILLDGKQLRVMSIFDIMQNNEVQISSDVEHLELRRRKHVIIDRIRQLYSCKSIMEFL